MPSITAVHPVAAAASSTPTRSDAPAPPPAPVSTEAPKLPEAPKPLTPATAAVHIMKVPTSRIIEAFAMMERARGQQGAAAAWPAAAPAPQRRIDLEA